MIYRMINATRTQEKREIKIVAIMEGQQQQIVLNNKWSNVLSLFLFSVGAHTFINKYVLSILKFQYPTMFISWQCGGCVVLLMTGYVLGYLQLSNLDSSLLREWAPCMVFYTVMLYSGSVSLSKLAVPIFLGLQNLTYWFTEFLTYWKSKKIPSITVQLSLFVVAIGTVLLIHSDLNRDALAYKWVLVYIISSGFYAVFSNIHKNVKLSDLDKAYSNSLFSVVSLILFSMLTGEWRETMGFPFLYYIRFHIGCIISGILCGFTALSLNILNKETSSEMIENGTSLNRILFSLISLGVLEDKFDTTVGISIVMLLVGGMVYTSLKLMENSVETEDLKNIRTS